MATDIIKSNDNGRSPKVKDAIGEMPRRLYYIGYILLAAVIIGGIAVALLLDYIYHGSESAVARYFMNTR